MSDRPTRDFKTGGGYTIVLNEYITGADNWAIRQVYMRGAKAEDAGAVALEAEKTAFNIVIVSIDGKTDNVADEVLKLPLTDYNEIVARVTPVIEGKKKS